MKEKIGGFILIFLGIFLFFLFIQYFYFYPGWYLAPQPAKPRYADAFLVILPQDEFTKEESNLIKEFKERGGKIFLIADPTRASKINSLATDLGIIFEGDYLYNQKEKELLT